MATDYLAELMKEAKEKNATPQNQEEKTIPQKPEDKEEELAREATKKEMQNFPETQMEAAPAEEKNELEEELEAEKKVELKSYGKVKIYKVPGKPLNYYYVPTTRPTAAERKIINTIKEATTRLISITPYKIRNPEERRIVYRQKVIDIIKNNPNLRIPESKISFYADAVVREMVGYGLIDDLIKDDQLEEIMVIGPKKPVFVFHREFEMMQTNIEFFSEQEIEDLVNRIAREIGRRVDVSAPLLDARLSDGSRVNATIPPASISGGTLTIRKFRDDPYSIIDLIRMNTLSSEAAAFLWLCTEGMGTKPANMLIAGGTGSGKTTLLNVLASFVPERERVITIEDTAELNLASKHWIRLEARPPGIEGSGELKMDILTKNSLRMRPDRILVGEIRHEEAFTLFTAINTGHDGAITGESIIQLSDGELIKIQELSKKYFDNPIKENDYEFAEINDELLVPSLNKETLKIENKKIKRIWRKKNDKNLLKIKLRSGKELILTKDHPIYKICNGISEINSENALVGDYVAIPTEIKIKSNESIECPYYLGLIYGDGHVGQESIEFTNKEKSLINAFREEAKQITKNKIKTRESKDACYSLFFDKKAVRNLNINYNIPIGNKTKTFVLGKEIMQGNEKDLGELIKGLFDCESHVNLHSNSIQFSTSNPDLAKKLPLILQRFGIQSSTNMQERDGRGNFGPYYRISIYGKDNLEKYFEKINYKHLGKKEALKKLIEQSKNSLDLFPNTQNILRNLRVENNLTQKELSFLIGNSTPSVSSAYETGARSPTRTMLKEICKKTNGKTKNQLDILTKSEIRFEQIVSISEQKYEGYIYDLTVEDNHNYIANGIIISNCLGTVHANSAEETIVRVTSPPMSVPPIMLSGLDFVIVEHRYYDRKKGTIRRLSEIAELYGALEGKPKTQTIFQRDAAHDKMERTIIDSKYLKTLSMFTGLSREQIEAEIEIRKQFLEKLINKNTRGLIEVSESARNFLEERKSIGETQ